MQTFRFLKLARWLTLATVAAATVFAQPAALPGKPLRVLLLGHSSEHHNSIQLYPLMAEPMARQNILVSLVLTPDEALRPEILQDYDAIAMYANHTFITPSQEKALLDYVEGGKGLVAIHCASAMFGNSEKFISLVGGAFLRHGEGDFTTEIVKPDHPIMQGIKPFTTWDETYVHNKHNPENRTVLMERVDAEGREPYTWVRTQGKGRIFYTAYGHDERTWNKPEFQLMLQNAVKWVVDDSARADYDKYEAAVKAQAAARAARAASGRGGRGPVAATQTAPAH
ncbi:MAG TPA: ThuA domain-containing protein [Bryobacteraceae bacterium]|nr:ThuA domain-containing protein [Bryobacteraceae bacterium]